MRASTGAIADAPATPARLIALAYTSAMDAGLEKDGGPRPFAAALGLVAVIAFAALSLPLAAESADEGHDVRESVRVDLVPVPVAVTDGSGRPVTDLTVNDFDLRDEGRPVAIQYVDTEDFRSAPAGGAAGGAPAAPPAAEPPPASARNVVLFFDLAFTTPAQLHRLRRAALSFVQAWKGPQDLFSVVVYSIRRGPQFVLNSSADRDALTRSIDGTGAANRAETSADPLNISLSTTSAGGKDGDDAIADMMDMAHAQDAARRRSEVRRLFTDLEGVAKRLDEIPGRKIVVYLSGGFDARLIEGDIRGGGAGADAAERAVQGQIWRIDSVQRFGESALAAHFNEVIQAFRRSDCVVYTVNAAGVPAGSDAAASGPGSGLASPGGGFGEDSLFTLADGTGGRLLNNANDFGIQIERALQAESFWYVLTFRPDRSVAPGAFHRLTIKVRRPHVRIAARSGYFEPGGPSEGSDPVGIAAILAGEIRLDAIPISMATLPTAGSTPAGTRVLAQFRIPEPLLSRPRLRASVYIYAFDSTGKPAAFLARDIDIDTRTARPANLRNGFLCDGILEIPPGRYRLRGLVREIESGLTGSATIRFAVAPRDRAGPEASPPLFLTDRSPMLVYLDASREKRSTAATQASSASFVAGPAVPSLAPRLASDGSATLYWYLSGVCDGLVGGRIGGNLTGPGGRAAGPANLAVKAVIPCSGDDRGGVVLDLSHAPREPGPYALRLFFSTADARESLTASTNFEVQ